MKSDSRNFIGRDEIFLIDDVKKCEMRFDFIKNGCRQNVSIFQEHVFL